MIAHAGVLSGVEAALWLVGLWYAAGLLSATSPISRLRDAITIGIAIPFGLAFCNLLYWQACWIVLGVVCVGCAYVNRDGERAVMSSSIPARGVVLRYAIVIAAAIAVAWPALARPLLEGDSLWYHLPNAASWVHGHGLWQTSTHYWWYPAAGELFASGLYAVAGPFAVGWSGFAALLLLGLRAADYAAVYVREDVIAGLIGAAIVTLPVVALQGGDLQNDVFLSAFMLEMLWTARFESAALSRTAAVCVLVKPQAFLYAAIAVFSGAAPRKAVGWPLLAVGLWVLRDALLWSHALFAPASAAGSSLGSTMILANPGAAFPELLRALVRDGWMTPAAFAIGASSILGWVRDRELRWSGTITAVLFFTLPFGFKNSMDVLANGSSLRFAIPTLVIGMLVAGIGLRKFPWVDVLVFALATVSGVAAVAHIFWNDASIHDVFYIAVGFSIVFVLVVTSRFRRFAPVVAAALVLYTIPHAARDPESYYRDALGYRVGEAMPFGWLRDHAIPRLIVAKLYPGYVNVLLPAIATIDGVDGELCVQMRSLPAPILTYDRAGISLQPFKGRSCANLEYRDRLSEIRSPWIVSGVREDHRR